MNVDIYIIHFNVAIYAAAYWSQMTVLPYLYGDLGYSNTYYGMTKTFMAVGMTVAGLGFGRLTDTLGGRVALSISQFGTAMSYMGLLLALNGMGIGMVVFSLFSMFMMVMQTAEAALSCLIKDEDRAKAIGRLSASYSVGRITGSFLGGWVSDNYGYAPCLFLAVGLSLTCSLISVFSFGHATTLGTSKLQKRTKANTDHEATPWWYLLTDLLLLKFLSFFCAAMTALRMFSSMVELIHKSHFGLSKSQAGYLMSYLSVIGVGAKSVVVGLVTDRLGGVAALQVSLFGLFISFFAFYLWSDNLVFYVTGICVLRSLSGALFTTICKGVLTSFVDSNQIGLVIAMFHAAWSVSGVFGPAIGTFLYEEGGVRLLSGVISCLLLASALAAPLLQQRLEKTKGLISKNND